MRILDRTAKQVAFGLSFSLAFGSAVLTPQILLAQEDAAQDETAAEEAASPVKAAPKGARLDEIVVTAQKRAQDVQDVPISVTAIGGEQIREMNLQNLTELTIAVPNVTIAASPSFSTVYIRGIGTGINDGFESSVGLYIDGVYMGRQSYLNDSMMDIEQIEVLRGPQGTLFGKNTVAGAISITNGIPDYDALHGSLDLMYGEDNNRRGNLMANIPIVDDKFALRVAGQWHKSDGAIYNQYRDVTELRNDKLGGRVKGRWDINENLNATMAVEYSVVKDTGQGFELLKGSDFTNTLYGLADPNHESHPDRVSHLDTDGFSYRTSYGGNLNVNASFGEYDVVFIAGYNDFDEEMLFDADAGPLPLLSWDNDDLFSQWQAELRLVSPPGSFEYIAGLFAYGNTYDTLTTFRQWDTDSTADVLLGGALPPALGDTLTTLLEPLLGGAVDPLTALFTSDALFQTFNQETLTLAAYAQVVYRPWEWLEVIGGLRYHWEEKEAEIQQEFESTGLVLSTLFELQAYQLNQTRSETNVAPRLTARWLVNEDINIYANVASGFKAGGFNPFAPGPERATFDEENSWTYEAGVKSEWFDRQLQVNLAVFRTEFEDMQISVLTGLGTSFFVDNAASATNQGFEWDVKMVLWEGSLIGMAGGYLDATYNNFEQGPCRAGEDPFIVPGAPVNDPLSEGFCDRSGERLVRAPRWDLAFTVNQAFPLGNLPFGMFVGADMASQTDHTTDIDNDPNTAQDAYMIVNARVGLADVDQRWVFSVNGHNILDEKIKGGVTDVPLQSGSYFGILAPGAFWTAEFRLTL